MSYAEWRRENADNIDDWFYQGILHQKIYEAGQQDADMMLKEIVEAVASIGTNWGCGEYQMLPTDPMVGKARKLLKTKRWDQ